MRIRMMVELTRRVDPFAGLCDPNIVDGPSVSRKRHAYGWKWASRTDHFVYIECSRVSCIPENAMGDAVEPIEYIIPLQIRRDGDSTAK